MKDLLLVLGWALVVISGVMMAAHGQWPHVVALAGLALLVNAAIMGDA